jgi:hypothetical protein
LDSSQIGSAAEGSPPAAKAVEGIELNRSA